MPNKGKSMLVAAAATLLWSFAGAQQAAQRTPTQRSTQPQPVTLDDRVAKLERDVASLSTRFETREAMLNTGANSASAATFLQLQNDVNRLSNDLQRVEREVDSAMRAANDAQRSAADAQRAAMDAEREARDATLRH